MQILEIKAGQVADKLTKQGIDNVAAFDPTIILVIIQIITMIFEAFKNCQKSKEHTLATVNNPNFLERFLLRRYIRQAFQGVSYHGISEAVLNKAMQEVGTSTTLLEVDDLLKLDFDLI